MSLTAPSTGDFLLGVHQPEYAAHYPFKPRADVKDEGGSTLNTSKLPRLV